METRCARCNAPMSCSPEGGCWCADLPFGPMPDESDGCLCPACLREDLAAANAETGED